jgi:hypothetical protein
MTWMFLRSPDTIHDYCIPPFAAVAFSPTSDANVLSPTGSKGLCQQDLCRITTQDANPFSSLSHTISGKQRSAYPMGCVCRLLLIPAWADVQRPVALTATGLARIRNLPNQPRQRAAAGILIAGRPPHDSGTHSYFKRPPFPSSMGYFDPVMVHCCASLPLLSHWPKSEPLDPQYIPSRNRPVATFLILL